eukprot:Pgem_evm1s13241
MADNNHVAPPPSYDASQQHTGVPTEVDPTNPAIPPSTNPAIQLPNTAYPQAGSFYPPPQAGPVASYPLPQAQPTDGYGSYPQGGDLGTAYPSQPHTFQYPQAYPAPSGAVPAYSVTDNSGYDPYKPPDQQGPSDPQPSTY